MVGYCPVCKLDKKLIRLTREHVLFHTSKSDNE